MLAHSSLAPSSKSSTFAGCGLGVPLKKPGGCSILINEKPRFVLNNTSKIGIFGFLELVNFIFSGMNIRITAGS